jgi:predicted transcriptional regulator
VKYRSRTDIVAQILVAANGGATKTKIMYKAFLSYAQLKQYLEVLVENDLLEYDSKEENFKTSEKGIRFMNIYEKMDNFVEQEENYGKTPKAITR